MRTIARILMVVVTTFLMGCRNEESKGTATATSVSTTGTSPCPLSRSAEEANLRAQSGGYVRGPARDRVIVFVNGLFGDAVSTWQANNGAYWPSLVANDPTFNGADIYVHSFDSPKLTTAQSIDELAARMRDHLQNNGVFEKHRQVIFVCHSMGGLITRAFLLKLRPSPEKVPMIYFFATPTTGANVAQITNIISDNPQLKSMLPLREDGYVGDLQNAWLVTSDDPNLNYPARIASFCAYEKKDTFGVRIVERQSATNLCNRETRGVIANHLEIVKPDDPNTDPYVFFKVAYDRTVGPSSVSIQTALMSTAPPATANFVRTVPIVLTRSVSRDPLLVKQSRLDTSSVSVACGETKEGEIVAAIDLDPGQEIIGVRPEIQNATNVARSSVALIRHEGNTAVIRYSLTGVEPTTPGNVETWVATEQPTRSLAGRAATRVGGAALEGASTHLPPSARESAVAVRSPQTAAHLPPSTRESAVAVVPTVAVDERVRLSQISRRPEVEVDIRQLRVLRSTTTGTCPGNGRADVVVTFVLRTGAP